MHLIPASNEDLLDWIEQLDADYDHEANARLALFLYLLAGEAGATRLVIELRMIINNFIDQTNSEQLCGACYHDHTVGEYQVLPTWDGARLSGVLGVRRTAALAGHLQRVMDQAGGITTDQRIQILSEINWMQHTDKPSDADSR